MCRDVREMWGFVGTYGDQQGLGLFGPRVHEFRV